MTQWPYDHFPTGGDEGGIPPIDDELRIHLDAVLGTVPESRIGSGELGFGKLLALVDRLAAAERTEFAADGRPSLRSAVAEAIAGNRKLAEATAEELRTLAGSLQATTPSDAADGGELTQRVLDAERTLLAELTRELTELAHRQLDGTDSFNIVLFGRTGTGKSSLMEALRHGDGHAISPGDSDWTTTVDPVSWAHCRLVDTPGIEGWGRTMSRRDLEEQAREELVTADIVILCFDTQNQKAGEFRKVAAWIAEYRKPVVAVLNVRPPNWRFPTRVPRRAVRQRSSQTVAEHATHIREGLTRDRPDRHADHRAQQPASGLRPGPQAILGARRSSWRPCWPIARRASTSS